MKIKRAKIHDFSAFADVEIPFSPGINVFIGENSTGKSHLLKLLYSVVKVNEEPGLAADALRVKLRQKLDHVFKPDDHQIGRLVRRKRGHHSARVEIETARGGMTSFSLSTRGDIDVSVTRWPQEFQCVFLPSREVLALYERFIGLYDLRDISIDETYYDAIKALSTPVLRGPRGEAAHRLFAPIEEALGGEVWNEGGRFYVALEGGNMEAHLVSEGLRKLASVAFLIKNGTLRKNSVLFWDEPEANLNPRLIRRVADFLTALAESGVQVFLATHDYLLSQQISLAKEFATTKAEMRFVSFERKRGGVAVEGGETISDLESNPILDEFLKHHKYENKLLWDEQTRLGPA